MYWLLFYDLVDDYLDRRPPLREEQTPLVFAPAMQQERRWVWRSVQRSARPWKFRTP